MVLAADKVIVAGEDNLQVAAEAVDTLHSQQVQEDNHTDLEEAAADLDENNILPVLAVEVDSLLLVVVVVAVGNHKELQEDNPLAAAAVEEGESILHKHLAEAQQQ